MAIVQDTGDKTPQPDPGGGAIARATEYEVHIPWYRNIKVLRVLVQVVFLVGFIAGTIFLLNNLDTNLRESNLALNFDIYAAPFTVAISEGPSVTTDWEWLQNTQTIIDGATIIYILIALVLIFVLYRSRQDVIQTAEMTAKGLNSFGGFLSEATNGRIHFRIPVDERGRHRRGLSEANPTQIFLVLLMLGVLALVALEIAPPAELPEILNRYFYGGSMTRAFVTGIANTLRVVVLSLIACTFLGVLVGVALLSRNFLVRSTAKVYVEIFRNTPLLVQLLFIYRSLTLLLPRPVDSFFSSQQFPFISTDYELYAFNTRGFYFASPVATESFPIFALFSLAGIGAFLILRRARLRVQEETGEPARTMRYGLPVLLGLMAVGWLLSGGWPLPGQGPFVGSYPAVDGRNVSGGTYFTIAFFSLFLGLTLYTGAFIAEIVRAGIQSVPYGQIEAARSQGLRGSQVLNLIVLPQALRLIIPPLGNQYVNLGKNSSLGLAVTYVDTYRVAQLANNESGQAVPFFVGLMVIYLALSLTLSVLTNFVNRSTRLRTR
ncbi:MAG: ABC transporter permease subunit [Chloroflexota bacterium]